MVLADSEDIESNLIGVLDLLDQVAQTLRWTERSAGVGVRRGEAIDSDFHGAESEEPSSACTRQS